MLILAPEAYLPLRQLGTHFHASAEGLAAVERVFAVLETAPPPVGHAPVPPGPARLELAGVTVAFAGRAAPALDSFSLRVDAGEIVALTGPSGCGKVHCARSGARVPDPDAGVVRVDGADLAGIDPDGWRSRVACVPQHPYLFAGTVAQNIALGQRRTGPGGGRRGGAGGPDRATCSTPWSATAGPALGRGAAAGRAGPGIPAGRAAGAPRRADRQPGR